MPKTNRSTIRVVLVDKRPLVLAGLRHFIEGSNLQITVVGAFQTAQEALEAPSLDAADIVLLGLYSNAAVDPSAVQKLSDGFRAKVIVVADSQDDKVMAAAEAGAFGCVEIDLNAERILQAIAKVHDGQIWYSRSMLARLFPGRAGRESRNSVDDHRSKISLLTKREREIVAMTTGHVDRKLALIANQLHVSESTLRNHLTSIYEKLGLANRLELFAYVNKTGLEEFRS